MNDEGIFLSITLCIQFLKYQMLSDAYYIIHEIADYLKLPDTLKILKNIPESLILYGNSYHTFNTRKTYSIIKGKRERTAIINKEMREGKAVLYRAMVSLLNSDKIHIPNVITNTYMEAIQHG